MRVAILVAVLVSGCAAVPPECKTEYGYTISHCAPRPRAPENAKECKLAGGVALIVARKYSGCMSREQARQEIERVLREIDYH